jgi:hypothetical protein
MIEISAGHVEWAVTRALIVRRDTPRADMDTLATILSDSITLLLPAGRIHANGMWRGGIPWSTLNTRLAGIKHRAEAGLGTDGPIAAMTRLRTLALDCQWLMNRYGPGMSGSGPADESH